MPTPLVAIAAIGPTAANVTPMTTGRRMPNFHTPRHWINVAMPQANRSALMRNAIWSLGSLNAPTMISGTAIAPAYITSTCCNPTANMGPAGKTSSTGWTRSRDALIVSLPKKASSAFDQCREAEARDLVDLVETLRELFGRVIVSAPRTFCDHAGAIVAADSQNERETEICVVARVELTEPRELGGRAMREARTGLFRR